MWVIFWVLLTVVFFVLAIIVDRTSLNKNEELFVFTFLACSFLSFIATIVVFVAWVLECPKCNTYGMKFHNTKYCTECGYEFKTEINYCKEGHSNSINSKFCSECGENLER